MNSSGGSCDPVSFGSHYYINAAIGARCLADNLCLFAVWPKNASTVDLRLLDSSERIFPLMNVGNDYFRAEVENVGPGALYYYRLNQAAERPEPVSRFHPEGVHGPSQIIDQSFTWKDDHWFGLPVHKYLIYELHVDAYTEDGTLDAVISHLAELSELGVTAIELLPVAQFPGERNRDYDGFYPFAVQTSYGGPAGLTRLVDASYQQGLAVIIKPRELGGYNLAQWNDAFLPEALQGGIELWLSKSAWGLALFNVGPIAYNSKKARRL